LVPYGTKEETAFKSLPEKKSGVLFRVFCGWLGLFLLLAALLPLKIIRAREENSFWIDEIYSIMIVERPLDKMIQLTSVDDHPPLFYTMLKCWNELGKIMDCAPSLLWSRCLNLVLWIVFSVAVWFISARILGRGRGALLSWVILIGAQVAHVTKEIRSYALAMFAVFFCFLILLYLREENRKKQQPDTTRKKHHCFFWILYALCGIIGLYSHLLTSFILFSLGIFWMVLCFKGLEQRRSFFRGGAAAHAAIVLVFLPWAFRIGTQLEHIQADERLWMTPRSLWNFIRVFIFWFPYGRVFDPGQGKGFVIYLLGSLSLVLPWGAVLLGEIWGKQPKKKNGLLPWIALAGAGISIFCTTLLFLLHKWGGIQVFHGPRYPSLATPFWSVGLIAAGIWASRKLGRKTFFVFFLLLPWFFCSLYGQVWKYKQEKRGGLFLWKKIAKNCFPQKGDPLYVLPPELIPYFRKNLEEFDVKSIDYIGNVPLDQKDVFVLDLNFWSILQKQRDIIFLTVLKQGRLSRKLERKEEPKGMMDFRNYHLKGFDHKTAQELFGNGIKPATRDIPSHAVSRALPQEQRLSEGWSFLECDDDMYLFRWGLGNESRVRFDIAPPPGNYKLHLFGYRTPYPEETVDMNLKFVKEQRQYVIPTKKGLFHIKGLVRITRNHKELRIVVNHPVWSPYDYISGNDDKRNLSFLFKYAWLERTEEQEMEE